MGACVTIPKIVKRNGSLVDYDRERITDALFKALTAAGLADRALADRLSGQVEAALLATYSGATVPSVEDIQDVVENTLMREGYPEIARRYIIYRHERAMERAARMQSFEVSDNVPYRKIYEVLRWNVEHGCDSVEGLNRLIRDGRLPELIAAGESRYSSEVGGAAAQLLRALPGVRVVIVAGPSSSGKTTTLIKVSEALARAGVRFKGINVDHYFFNLVDHPRDDLGDYDYEAPRALDMALIDRHLACLLAGEEVRTPHYDFKTGRRTLDVHPLRLAADEVLLIDSLHGLYDGMTASVPAGKKFKLYIETLGQFRCEDGTFMRWADNRLLRRMIRDKQFRNLQPLETLSHWHYVRKSELSHIIPFIGGVDAIVNSAMPFELPFLKAKLMEFVDAGIRLYRDDPRRLDAYIRAKRVHALLAPVCAVSDDAMVPPDSLLREFIGGSRYTY